ncbi:MAG: hypothetical protein ACTSQK_12635, partial [Candidatus Heimdallarchaeota archaeon]
FTKQNWRQRRNAFVARHLIQYNKKPTPRRWLALVMWAYKPPGRRPKKSTKKVKYVRKTSRGVARTFKMKKRRKSKKPPPFQGHVRTSRGGTPQIFESLKLGGYNPNFSDVTPKRILNSKLPPLQKYLLLGVWAAATYSPATEIPDIIRGDGGYLQLGDQTPGIIPMGASSAYATYSPGALLKGIAPKHDMSRKDTRNKKNKRRKKTLNKKGKKK